MLFAPPDFPVLECGRAGVEHMSKLVRYLRRTHSAVAEGASYSTVRAAFVRRFLRQFVKHRRVLDVGSLSSVMDKTANEVASALRPRTVGIPCLLWQWEEPPRFAVGPVQFERATAFFSDPKNALSNPDGKPSLRTRALAEEAGWIATVTVTTMDDSTAEYRARDSVDAAINVLKLFVDPDRTRECRRADAWGPAPDYALFLREESGAFACSLTRRGADALAWENWATCFEGQLGTLFKIAEAAVFGLLSFQPSFPLQARFLDALKWFGDGASDASLAARITKYAFAWERLVITRKYELGSVPSLTTAVCGRLAILCDRTTGEPRQERLLQQIEELYDVRSRLAHGSASPWNRQELRTRASEAEALTVRALFGALLHYWLLKQGGATDKELEESFALPASPDASLPSPRKQSGARTRDEKVTKEKKGKQKTNAKAKRGGSACCAREES